jgi:hypothetical protein
MHIDTVEDNALRGTLPSTAKQIYAVTSAREPAENLMEMKLCSARLRVLAVLPVEYEDSH